MNFSNFFDINSIVTSFLAAVFTLISPCIFPVLPVYFSLISGYGHEDYKNIERDKVKKIKLIKNTISASFFFILGFSIIFITFGLVFLSFSNLLRANRSLLQKISSIIIFLFGVFILLQDKFSFLSKEIKFLDRIKLVSGKKFTAFLLGLSLSLGWTPCISPFLGTIILNASIKETAVKGLIMLIFYCFSLLLFFILIGLLFIFSIEKFKLISKKVGIIKIISGFVLMIIGILLFFRII